MPLHLCVAFTVGLLPFGVSAQEVSAPKAEPLKLDPPTTPSPRGFDRTGRLELPGDFDPEEELPTTGAPGRATYVMSRSRPEYDAIGFNLGGFTAFPEVSARVGYDGNVIGQTNSGGDVYGGVRGSVRLASDWGTNALEVTGFVDERAYAKFTSESGVTYRLRVRGRLDISRDTALTLGAEHERAFVQRGNTSELLATLRPTRFNLTEGIVGLSQNFGRLQTQIRGTIGKYDFEDAQTPDGLPLDQQYRDNVAYRGEANVGYAFASGPVAFVSVSRELRRYRIARAPLGRDSNVWEVLGGLRGELTPLISGSIGLGYIHVDFAAPGLQSRGAFSFDGNLDYAITELTTINLNGRRYFQNVASPTSAGGLATELELGVDHELLRNVILSGMVSYRSTEYSELSTTSRSYGATAGARWLIDRHLRTNATLGYSQREGGRFIANRSYNEVVGQVSVTYAF